MNLCAVFTADASNRKRPLQALSTLEEDASAMLMSAINEEADAEGPLCKNARHSIAGGRATRLLTSLLHALA
jgi:hypothetical protein